MIQTDTTTVDYQLTRAGVPLRYRDKRLETFEATETSHHEALQAIGRALDPQRRAQSVYLWGPAGTGKTHLVVGLLARMAETRQLADEYLVPSGRFVVVPELLDQIRGTIGWANETVDPMHKLLDVPLLILDDLGAEKATDWVFDRLYVLVNARYNAKLTTIVTTNDSPGQLASAGYGRIVSRLLDDAQALYLTGPDRRLPTPNAQSVHGGA